MKKYILAAILMTALTLTAVACDLIEVPGEITVGEITDGETTDGETSDGETDAETAPTATAPVEPDTPEETYIETSPVTEIETTAVTEAETETEPQNDATETVATETDGPSDERYIQFPLTGADDTTSYVSLPDMTAEGAKAVEFFILPSDTEDPELTGALKLILPENGEANIQVISFKAENSYGIIFMLESTYTILTDGVETRYVRMQSSCVSFFDDKVSIGIDRYYHMNGGGSANLQYTDQNRQAALRTHRYNNITALKQVDDLLYKYNDPETYDLTVLYSYMNGEETVNTPVEDMPAFPFELFNEYGFDN